MPNQKGKKIRTLHIELVIRVKRPAGMNLTEKFLREVIEYWVLTGIEPHDIEVKEIRWTRDEQRARKAPGDDTLNNARETLLRRFLYSVQFKVTREAQGYWRGERNGGSA